MTDHWFEPPPSLCTVCGESPEGDRHHRRCNPTLIYELGRPGNGWCRLPAGHDGACELVWWNGEVTNTHGFTIEEAKPFRIRIEGADLT